MGNVLAIPVDIPQNMFFQDALEIGTNVIMMLHFTPYNSIMVGLRHDYVSAIL